MKVTATIFASIFLFGSSVGYAETDSSTKTIEMGVSSLATWSAGDHLGAARRYEEEARLLQAEARGMEHVEIKILPFLEVEAIKEVGVQNLIDRRLKEAEESMRLANWHHQEAMLLLGAMEFRVPVMASQNGSTSGQSQTSKPSTGRSYKKYDWIEEQEIMGW